jgi:hypothetical protein
MTREADEVEEDDEVAEGLSTRFFISGGGGW